MEEKTLNLATLAQIFADEDKAREFLEQKRWPNGPVCPHCESEKAYALTAKPDSKRPVRKGVYKCSACRKQFTVTVGTIFENSRIEIRKWLMTVHLMTSSKKGVSAAQIEREVGVTYKSAWFMCHRIREAMKSGPLALMLGGNGKAVEADETYVGGKKKRGVKGRGAVDKAPVQVIVERGASVIAKHVEKANGKTLKYNIKQHVEADSLIVTDQASAYIGIGRAFKGGHVAVNHSVEYVDINGQHTNTAESFNALLKRGHYGVFHQMSKKHLHRYCDEFSFRWNTRKVSDGERMVAVLGQVSGKRVRYRELTEVKRVVPQ